MLVCKLACFVSNTHVFTVPLDKFCEDIPMRALKQFSTAILAAAQRDRAGAPPQETDPDLVNAWIVLQKKVLAMVMNYGFSVTSLGPG
jgi:hypothetical protein